MKRPPCDWLDRPSASMLNLHAQIWSLMLKMESHVAHCCGQYVGQSLTVSSNSELSTIQVVSKFVCHCHFQGKQLNLWAGLGDSLTDKPPLELNEQWLSFDPLVLDIGMPLTLLYRHQYEVCSATWSQQSPKKDLWWASLYWKPAYSQSNAHWMGS